MGVDYATRYIEVGTMSNGKSPGVAKFLVDHAIPRYKAPRITLSDRGAVFRREKITSPLKRVCYIKLVLLRVGTHQNVTGCVKEIITR